MKCRECCFKHLCAASVTTGARQIGHLLEAMHHCMDEELSAKISCLFDVSERDGHILSAAILRDEIWCHPEDEYRLIGHLVEAERWDRSLREMRLSRCYELMIDLSVETVDCDSILLLLEEYYAFEE